MARPKHKLAHNTCLVLCAAVLPFLAGPVFGQESDLPDIGSPSDAVLSKQMERQIGRSIFRSLRATGNLVEDPEVNEYIQDVGQKLVANAQDGSFTF